MADDLGSALYAMEMPATAADATTEIRIVQPQVDGVIEDAFYVPSGPITVLDATNTWTVGITIVDDINTDEYYLVLTSDQPGGVPISFMGPTRNGLEGVNTLGGWNLAPANVLNFHSEPVGTASDPGGTVFVRTRELVSE